MKLVVEGPTFFSPNDEAALFGWLKKLRFIACKGVGRELHLEIATAPSDAQLRDLIALFLRYGLGPMSQLAALRTPKNEAWFADPEAHWFAAVFGKAEF